MSLSRRIQYALLVGALLLMVFFNIRHSKVESVEQRQFESWLSQHDTPSDKPPVNEISENVVVSLSGMRRTGEAPIVWQLRSLDGEVQREKAIRILQIAREANLFSVARELSSDQGLILEVQEGNRKFTAGITPLVAEQNVKVAMMLRLFQEYATPIPAKVASVETTGGNSTTER